MSFLVSIIKIKDLWKIYKKDIVALRGLSLDVNYKEIFTLLGPNGAGKTTTIRILSCIIKPSKGYVEVDGYKIPVECKKIRKIIGVVPQEFEGFNNLTVRENIEYFSNIYSNTENIDSIIESLGLKEYENYKYSSLSGGLKRKVAIGSSLVGNVKILFLDEPTVGLDPKSRRELWELIRSIRNNGITIVLTTHYLEEAELLSDRVGVIYKGDLIRVARPNELKEEFKKGTLEEAYLSLLNQIEEKMR
jgi:ABC-2 type transport system ATP-binding protein